MTRQLYLFMMGFLILSCGQSISEIQFDAGVTPTSDSDADTDADMDTATDTDTNTDTDIDTDTDTDTDADTDADIENDSDTAPPAGATWTNGQAMTFVRVEPGSFVMGEGTNLKLNDDEEVDHDEQPAHKVTLTYPFYILQSTVTQAQYNQSGGGGSADDISWHQADAFCKWLSQQDGLTYRLPTEAEWEYVFEKSANALKMNGREWVNDWHSFYPHSDVVDPVGPQTGILKVIRSGGRDRLSLSPDATSEWGFPSTAFRVVVLPQPVSSPYRSPASFFHSAVLQSKEQALQGPDPSKPYFTVRLAVPIPPDNDDESNGPYAGTDQGVMSHQHSPGMEVLPNGDVFAVYFSASNRRSEHNADVRWSCARLRYGSDQWDMLEMFYDRKRLEDESGLLWTEGDTVRFFGGARIPMADKVPFQIGVSADNGATWDLQLPRISGEPGDYTPQPIVNAFYGSDGNMYMAMDGNGGTSLLWRSTDGGVTWNDQGGRTGGRHSTIVELMENGQLTGKLISMGGKNTNVNGKMPRSYSTDWGKSWSENEETPFSPLATNQRPSLIRLRNGDLLMATDMQSYRDSEGGGGCEVALSKDGGKTWTRKTLPVQLVHQDHKKFGTLGYSTLREAPNGVIHLLTTSTHPCIHYEFNLAWFNSGEGDIQPETTGGTVKNYVEKYPSGGLRAQWSARITPGGRYLLDGVMKAVYPNGKMEYQAEYVGGRKTGDETYWDPSGFAVWTWRHSPQNNTATLIRWWHKGYKRIESQWSTFPRARDLDRRFSGLVADGEAKHWDAAGKGLAAYSFQDGAFKGESGNKPADQTTPSAPVQP